MSDWNIVKFIRKVLKWFDKTPPGERFLPLASGSHTALEIIYTMSKFQVLIVETIEGENRAWGWGGRLEISSSDLSKISISRKIQRKKGTNTSLLKSSTQEEGKAFFDSPHKIFQEVDETVSEY